MKIVLLHNEIKPFRLPLFNYLNSIYDVKIYCLRSNKLTENNIKDVEYGRYIRIPKMLFCRLFCKLIFQVVLSDIA